MYDTLGQNVSLGSYTPAADFMCRFCDLIVEQLEASVVGDPMLVGLIFESVICEAPDAFNLNGNVRRLGIKTNAELGRYMSRLRQGRANESRDNILKRCNEIRLAIGHFIMSHK